jgi:hypothetical protein
MNKKMLIFTDAYGSLNFLIYFIDNNLCKYETIKVIMFDSENYYKLLNKMNVDFWNEKLVITNIPKFNSSRSLNKFYNVFIDVFREKKYLTRINDKYFNDIVNYDIFFMAKKYMYNTFHFVSKLSASNKTFLLDADNSTNSLWNIPLSFKDVILYFRSLLLYNHLLIFKRESSSSYVQISNKYLIKYKINEIYSDQIFSSVNETFIKYIQKFTYNYKVLFIDQGLESEGILSNLNDAYFFEKLFSILKKEYDYTEICIKLHPTQHTIKDTFKDSYGIIVDQYIPGEFLCSHKIDLVISGYSNVLKTNNYNTSISLLYMLGFDDARIDFLFKYLSSGAKSIIYFPKNWDDFTEIVKLLKKHY